MWLARVLTFRTAKAVFWLALGALAFSLIGPSPPPASPTGRGVDAQFGDALSPGFFSPPPGVRPVNRIVPSRIPGARRSYAWRYHRNTRELVAFSTPIQHVVVIYMENRTPEDLFAGIYSWTNPITHNTFGHDLKLIDPNSISLTPWPLTSAADPDHSHWGFHLEIDNGDWDKGYKYVLTPPTGSLVSPAVANYIKLIEDWAYNNSTLQANEGPSFIAHQYAIAGQSGGLSSSQIAPNGMTDNPSNPGGDQPGDGTCYTSVARAQTVLSVDMYSPYPTPTPTPASFVASPCVEYTTILDFMASAAPLTSPYYQWQYVAKDASSIWSAPMAVYHLYAAYSADPNPDKTGQPFAADPDAENFVLNVSRSTHPTPSPERPFAELTFLTPCLGESDHPNTAGPNFSSYDDGPDWLAYVLNAIGESGYWDNTAVIVTWDDWGGWYDNFTAPPAGASWPYHPSGNPYSPAAGPGNPSDPNEWGFRVPLIMISPYVKSPGYISSTFGSQGAILNFIETIFGLGTNVLHGDDATNGSNDLTDMLDLSSNTPLNWSYLSSNFTPMNNDTCPAADASSADKTAPRRDHQGIRPLQEPR